jgi:uncharacterized membrane protein YjgN (DUF898 family)
MRDDLSTTPAPTSQPLMTYEGKAGPLFWLSFRLACLSLITLGIYRFWGKTRVRRFLWSRIGLYRDRLEYTGTGKELFLGFLIVIAILIPLSLVIGVLQYFVVAESPKLEPVIQIVYYILLAFLVGIAIFRARRYRLSRTVWRGIRFGQTGSALRFARLFLGYGIITALTLGLARPLIDVRMQSYLMEHSWLGNKNFEFDGRARDLMKVWLACYFLAPFTLFLSLFWYSAAQTRYFAARTKFEGLEFELPVTFRDLAKIYVPYYLTIGFVFTILASIMLMLPMMGGLMTPVVLVIVALVIVPALQIVMVTHRMLKLIAEKLTVTGDADLDQISQNLTEMPSTGEGLADALDVGGGVDIGF